MHLVADIGGTNARFALVEAGSSVLSHIHTLQCESFGSPLQAIHHYLSQVSTQVSAACLALACPVSADEIKLTNNHWQFSRQALQQGLGINQLVAINDFTAAAMATTVVADRDLRFLSKGLSFDTQRQRAIIGPGTGLGVAGMLPHQGRTLVLSTEGGHRSFAPENEVEDYILQYLRAELGVVSCEELLSGRGLVNIYRALCSFENQPLLHADAESIGNAAQSGDAMADRALEQFFEILGSVAGDYALSLGATGGVYIGGGIPPRFSDRIANSNFRSRFENKLNFEHYLRDIATAIVVHPQPGLLGAAAYLSQLQLNQ
ncbi:glucokinase [Pleionea litopenaei]|uniref:Glucokinase n=1 Tax=Pleionea litopenaei TaxID=3070815 RepID=A0AA51RWV8_9GAMM|nr:glucokinase [Pleionea sp. HL-JVS1]WMS89256.1 glucokinase [Pleionea sp. HL-JVS1]